MLYHAYLFNDHWYLLYANHVHLQSFGVLPALISMLLDSNASVGARRWIP